jgi:hypothetical protein
MNRLHRAAFTLVILILSFLLFRVIHHAYSLPRAERQPQLPPEQSENVQAKNVQSGNLQAENVQPQKPSPQEIVRNLPIYMISLKSANRTTGRIHEHLLGRLGRVSLASGCDHVTFTEFTHRGLVGTIAKTSAKHRGSRVVCETVTMLTVCEDPMSCE